MDTEMAQPTKDTSAKPFNPSVALLNSRELHKKIIAQTRLK